MNRSLSLGLTMLTGVALGATAITGLNAQIKPTSPGASPAEPLVAVTSSEPQRPSRSTESRPSVSW
jgi:hypothetical protein